MWRLMHLIPLGAFAWLMYASALIKVGPFNCEWNSDVCGSQYCIFNRSRGPMSYLSVSCFTRHKFHNLMIHMRVLRKRGDKYEIYLINTKQNLCDFHGMYDDNPFVRHIFHLTTDYIKNIKCPMTGNLTVSRLPVMFYMANGLLPRTNYVVDVRLYEQNLTLLNINVTFNVT